MQESAEKSVMVPSRDSLTERFNDRKYFLCEKNKHDSPGLYTHVSLQ